MKKSLLAVFLLLTGIIQISQGQGPVFIPKWDNGLGGNNDDMASTFLMTSDSGFVIGGSSYSPVSGDKTQFNYNPNLTTADYWLVRTDSSGTKIWDKRFGGIGEDLLGSLIATPDGGFVAGGQSYSGISGDKTQDNWDPNQQSADYWMVKVDSNGIKQWDKRFGGSSFELFASMVQTDDGGYLLAGTSFSGISGDKTQNNQGGWDYWIVRTDSLGIKLWDKRFGGLQDDFATAIVRTSDGAYLIGGYSNSFAGGDKSQGTQGSWDYWIIKVNDFGFKVWDKTFGANYQDYLTAMTATSDGGFLLGGQSFSEATGDKSEPNHDATPAGSDRWIIRINAFGIKQWDHSIGGSDVEDLSRVEQTADGGFLLSGTSYSPADGNKTEPNLGAEQNWIVKTNNLGTVQWDKTIFTNGHDELGMAIPFNNSCFIAMNYTLADSGGYKTEMSQGLGDYWIIKMCKDQTTSAQEIFADKEMNVKLYPNPAADVLHISLSTTSDQIRQIELYDMNGKCLMRTERQSNFDGSSVMDMNVSVLKSGTYICKVICNRQTNNLHLVKF